MPTPTHLSKQLILCKSCSVRFYTTNQVHSSLSFVFCARIVLLTKRKKQRNYVLLDFWLIIERLRTQKTLVRNGRASPSCFYRNLPHFLNWKLLPQAYLESVSPLPGHIWSKGVLDGLNVFLGQGAVRPFGEKDWSHTGYQGSLFRAWAINSLSSASHYSGKSCLLYAML